MKPLDDNKIEKNPTPVGHPILEMDPSPPQPPSLFQVGENCVDLLEAILEYHRDPKHRKKN
jgi:hypothetical protein